MHLTYHAHGTHTGTASTASAGEAGAPGIETGMEIVAKFVPNEMDDLKIEARFLIGRVGIFEALWKISDGKYRGQWAMKIPRDWPISSACWVPECDLRLVPSDREDQGHPQ